MKQLLALIVALVVVGDSALAQRRGGGGGQGQTQGQEQGANAGQGRGGGGGGGGFGGRGRGAGAAAVTTGTAVIQGFVIVADTGSPVRRAEVRATSNATRTARVATTDDEGRFVLADLPAGQWNVTVSKGGFVSQQYGQRRPFEVVPPIQLADAERRTINFTLWRGAAINGYVYDEFGDPITGARVQVLRAQVADGQRRLAAVGMTAQTDDRGSFRLYGLSPGEYYVSATVRSPASQGADLVPAVESLRIAVRDAVGAGALAGGGGAVADGVRETLMSVAAATTYAPTYFPGTLRPGEAQRIRLMTPGEEADASFTLLPVRTVQVAGSIVGSTGAPVAAAITLRPMTGGDVVGPGGGHSGAARADGTFVVSGVVPGSYYLEVTTRGGRGASTGTEVASIPITVGLEGAAGVIVTTGPGARVSGSVVAAGNATPSTAGMQVIARGVRGNRVVQGNVGRDGTFSLNGLVGPYSLEVGRIPQGWMVESIVINGVDVTENPMEFRGTEQVAGVRVTLTDRLTEISGRVVSSRGEPAEGASVVIFPDNAARWMLAGRYLRSVRADAQGGFTTQGLPPGTYLAVAVNYLQQGEAQDPEFLESMRSRATSFSLASTGARAGLDLRLLER